MFTDRTLLLHNNIFDFSKFRTTPNAVFINFYENRTFRSRIIHSDIYPSINSIKRLCNYKFKGDTQMKQYLSSSRSVNSVFSDVLRDAKEGTKRIRGKGRRFLLEDLVEIPRRFEPRTGCGAAVTAQLYLGCFLWRTYDSSGRGWGL